jgi:pilus assembly protein CpaF
MVSMAGFDLPVAVTRRYIASAITLIVHLARLKGGVRRVMRISEITALESGDYAIQDLFGFRQTGIDDRGIARGHFYAAGNKPRFAHRLAEYGIDLNPKLFDARMLTTDSSIGPLSNAPTSVPAPVAAPEDAR